MNTAKRVAGLALQADRATTASAPAYSFGLTGGTPFDAEVKTETKKITGNSRSTTIGSYRTEISPSAGIETIAFADVLGLILRGGVGNVLTTGETAPYTHAFSPGPLPYLTAFDQLDGQDVKQVSSAKVDELEISFEGVDTVDITATLKGCIAKWLETNVWPGDAPDPSIGWFHTPEATVLISPNTDTPAVASGIIKSGSVSAKNNLDTPRALGSAQPADVRDGAAEFSGSFKLAPDDETTYRAVKTGSPTGTDVSTETVNGSFALTFKHSENPAWLFTIAATEIAFDVSAIDADVDGKAAEIDIKFDAAAELTFTLVNGTATYV